MRARSLKFRLLYGAASTALVAAGFWFLFVQRSEAQPYGIDLRVGNKTLKMPLTAPKPLGSWVVEYAFPNLRFTEPIGLTQPSDGSNRLFVLEQRGRIQMFENDPAVAAKTLFLDFSDRVSRLPEEDGHDETGALGFAFHPEFGQEDSPNRGFVFVYYTAGVDGKNRNRLSRFMVREGKTVADVDSEVVLIDQPDEDEIHKAGSIQFGPDGFLYLAVGDGGGGDTGYTQHEQKIDQDLFSGILRIDVDRKGDGVSHPPPRQPATAVTAHYDIPDDNPFVGVPNALEELWAIGLRNPFRISFDRLTGDLWCGEPGAAAREQIELIEKGSNHQWSYQEGTVPFRRSSLQGEKPLNYFGTEKLPVHEYLHFLDNRCVIGGYVYRGKQHDDLVGKYIYGDFVSGRVWALDYDGAQVRANTELLKLPSDELSGVSSFGEDQAGELYLCYLVHKSEKGAILKLKQSQPPHGPDLPDKLSQTGIFSDLASLTPHPGIIPYTVNAPFWSDGARKRRWISVPTQKGGLSGATGQIGFVPVGEWDFPDGTVFIKHFDLPIDETDPSVTKRLETRVLVRDRSGGVYGVTYKWNDEQTDATLLPGSLREEVRIHTADGKSRTQSWYYPSREDCLVCHNRVAKHVLGVNTRQLNGMFTYPETDVVDNQLRTWNHLRLFRVPLDEAQIADYSCMVPLDDPDAPLQTRARSYLDSNCAPCHRTDGGARAYFDTRYDLPLQAANLIGGKINEAAGTEATKVIVPNDLEKSLLYQRMNAAHIALRMPPLATNRKDQQALNVLAEWIRELGTAE